MFVVGDSYGSICELVQGRVVDGADFLGGPIGAGSGCGCSLHQHTGDPTGDRSSTGRALDSPVGPPGGPRQGPGEVEGHDGGGGMMGKREERGKKKKRKWKEGREEVYSRRGDESEEKRGRTKFTGVTVTTILWGKSNWGLIDWFNWLNWGLLTNLNSCRFLSGSLFYPWNVIVLRPCISRGLR